MEKRCVSLFVWISQYSFVQWERKWERCLEYSELFGNPWYSEGVHDTVLDPNANRRSVLRERRLKGVARWKGRVRLGKEGISTAPYSELVCELVWYHEFWF